MVSIEIDIAIAKTNKYASRESGDTAELVERPGGGLSAILSDGQGSGRAAKSLSLLVTSKAVALLKEGVRDGAAARAVHDYLFAYRHGQVSATLDILSADLASLTVLVTRNADTPMLVARDGLLTVVTDTSGPIGRYHLTRPTVSQLPLAPGLAVVVVSDGVIASGKTGGRPVFDLAAVAAIALTGGRPADEVAGVVLDEAVRRDNGRPTDDLTVIALVVGAHDERLLIRRQRATVPVP